MSEKSKECIVYLGFNYRYPDSFSFTYVGFILDLTRFKKTLLIDRKVQDPFEIINFNKYTHNNETGCLKIWVNRFLSSIKHNDGIVEIFDDFYNNLKKLRSRGIL